MTAIPVIDVSALVAGDDPAGDLAAAIGAACREVRSVYLAGHPLPADLNAAVFATAAQFLAQGDAEKRSPADLNEAFNIGPELRAMRGFRAANACLTGCATPDRPARYRPDRGDAFLTARLSPTYKKSGLA